MYAVEEGKSAFLLSATIMKAMCGICAQKAITKMTHPTEKRMAHYARYKIPAELGT